MTWRNIARKKVASSADAAILRTVSAKSELERLRSACQSSKVVVVVDNREFGEVLRYHRNDAKLTLRTMATRLGVSAAFLSDCERGNRKLSDAHQLQFVQECMKENRKRK